MTEKNHIYCEPCLKTLSKMEDGSIDCVVTSPPYWGLRDYGVDGQLGLEKTPEEYVEKMVEIFREIKRALKPEGTVWLNLGDSYSGSGGESDGRKNKDEKGSLSSNNRAKYNTQLLKTPGLKPKDLCGIPWRVTFALQADGWYLRSDIIWHKPNPMPESVTDRPTKSHEYIFLLTKSAKYYYDAESIREDKKYSDDPGLHGMGNYKDDKRTSENRRGHYKELKGANKRSVWTVNTQPFPDAHFAVFPTELIVPCVKAGCPKGGIVYDPFMGSGTTAEVALRLDRNYIGSELNADYIKIANKRLKSLLNQVDLFYERKKVKQ